MRKTGKMKETTTAQGRKCRILFVEAIFSDSARFSGECSLSLYVLATYLKDRFPETAFSFEFSSSIEMLDSDKPGEFDFCCIYSPSQAWENAKTCAAKARKFCRLVIVGGPHISSLPKSFSEEFDLGCSGPGEPFLEALILNFIKNGNQIDLSNFDELRNLPGAIFRQDNQIEVCPARFQKDYFEKQASPYKYFLQPNVNRCRIISSIGCVHNCYFCSAKVLNPKLFFRSAETIAEEIEELHLTYNIRNFKFIDDNFLVNLPRLERLVECLREKGILAKISTSCTASSSLINERSVAILRQLNTESVNFGFESGSPRILKKLKGCGVTIESHLNAIKLLNQNRIMVYGTFVIGTPGETIEDLRMTLDFVKKNRIHHLSCYLLKPLPGTPFWQELSDKKQIREKEIVFSELAFLKFDPKWYFNPDVPLSVSVNYIRQINRIGTIRTVLYHVFKPFFYRFVFNQLILTIKKWLKR